MPRNDQVTRQWYILRTLEDSRGYSLEELAQALPPEYTRHIRTIRRDIAALESAGFPLLDERIEGRVRWRLMDGFRRIPAISFSATELMALAVGRGLLKPLEGTQVQSALDSALNKVTTALPPPSHRYVDQMDGIFSIGLGPHKSYRLHREIIDRLTQAATHKKTAQIRYFSASRGKETRREVDPYKLWYASGGLYLIAHCHVREEVRLFAVERIRSVTLTDHPYQMPLGFDIESYVKDALTVMRGPRIAVELLFSKKAAAWVRDRIWHASQKLAPVRGGQLRMTLTVADTRELVGWVLSFGSDVTVIQPQSLHTAVADEARKILQKE